MFFFRHGHFWGRFALLFFAAVSPAYAYLDPGSGSYILQLLLGGIAGLVVIAKLYWNHFLAFIGSLRAPNSKPTEDDRNGSRDS